jgi:hypothetical protein
MYVRVLIIATVVSLTPSAFAKATITFENRAVVARVTPGASTAWYSVIHDGTGFGMKVIRRAFILQDEDRDGIVRVELSDDTVRRSVFMVVDLSNGERAIEAPPGIRFRLRPLPPSAFVSRGSPRSAAVLNGSDALTVFWFVRPGVGAWVATVEDGSVGDGDGIVDGNVSALLARFVPVGSSPGPPNEFSRDDIVVAIAPLTLDIFEGRVPQ